MNTILTIIFCFVLPFIPVAAVAISGTLLKNWYWRNLAKLDISTQSKIRNRQMTVLIFPLVIIIGFVVGIIWPSLHVEKWYLPFFCSFVALIMLLTLFDYYDVYRKSKSLSDIGLK
jgi:hypothetical protein